jgi:uncharacterized RDD family membrane protein YckC
MSDPPDDCGGLTAGDPLGGDAEPPLHESGLPAYEPPVARPGPQGGYSSPPPPGALGAPGSATSPISARYTLASWWSRVGSTLIDGIIIGIGAILITIVFGSVFSIGFAASDEAGAVSLVVGLMLAFVAIAIVSFLYAPLMMARTNGKTVGRMAMGIRVVRASGEAMTFSWAMLREVVIKALVFGVLSSLTFGLASLLDVLWPLWDDEHRALHDFVVDTRVVRD